MLDAAIQPGESGKSDNRCDFERAQPNLAQDDPGRDHPDRDDREQSPGRRVIGAVAERGADHRDGPENGHEETVGPNQVARAERSRLGGPAGEAHVARLITHAPPLGDCGRPELLIPPSRLRLEQVLPQQISTIGATGSIASSGDRTGRARRRITPPRLSSAARQRWETARVDLAPAKAHS